ncbi:MAG: Crp/Fnr family transcriptional regulator [Alphaproteobacteria bacterium]|nr:MAG: Crp/Fnr family transcriptional regulator [Alphaproteobacteria bacterium]
MQIVLSIQSEQAELIDRMVTVGRHSAESRLAAFLLDLRDRLRPLHQVTDNAFDLPVTQLDMADLLGLTAVHTNRVLRSLTEQGYIQRIGRRIALLDEAALSKLAPYRTREPMENASWLPG